MFTVISAGMQVKPLPTIPDINLTIPDRPAGWDCIFKSIPAGTAVFLQKCPSLVRRRFWWIHLACGECLLCCSKSHRHLLWLGLQQTCKDRA